MWSLTQINPAKKKKKKFDLKNGLEKLKMVKYMIKASR